MLKTKRIMEMARKWHKSDALGRRRITSARSNGRASPMIASKGHIFMCTIDAKRFMIPIAYLSNDIFRELFKMSEDEFGLPSDGPITLPCNAASTEYIVSLLMNRMSKDVERNFLHSILDSRRQCTTARSLFLQGHSQEQLIVCGY